MERPGKTGKGTARLTQGPARRDVDRQEGRGRAYSGNVSDCRDSDGCGWEWYGMNRLGQAILGSSLAMSAGMGKKGRGAERLGLH